MPSLRFCAGKQHGVFSTLGRAVGWTTDSRTSACETDTSSTRVTQRDGESARLLVGMPASGSPQYWVYARPEDAADWVGQLLTWIDEEVFTDGLGLGRIREDHGGESFVVVANYGWHQTDTEEHARLTAAAGLRGWHGSDSA